MKVHIFFVKMESVISQENRNRENTTKMHDPCDVSNKASLTCSSSTSDVNHNNELNQHLIHSQ